MRRHFMFYSHLAMASLIAVGAIASDIAQPKDRILDLPPNYRQNYTEYFRGDRFFHDNQTIRIYANDIAKESAISDGTLPYGSILVAEVFVAQSNDDGEVIESIIGRRLPGDMKVIAVMERQPGWDDQYPEALKVGDWEFELFSPDGVNLGKDMTECRQCHAPLHDSEYVYSIEHLAAAPAN